MKKKSLVCFLKKRLIKTKKVPRNILLSKSDNDVILAYLRDPDRDIGNSLCIDDVEVTIEKSKSTKEFLEKTEIFFREPDDDCDGELN